MLTETLTQHGDVVGIACEGTLSEDDLKRMHGLLHERLEAAAMPGLVVDLSAGIASLFLVDEKAAERCRAIGADGNRFRFGVSCTG